MHLLGIVEAMSVRMKITHSKTGSRRAHHRVGIPRLVTTKTGVRRRHFIDPDTGMYRGKQIITIGKPEVVTSKTATSKAKKGDKKEKEAPKKAEAEKK